MNEGLHVAVAIRPDLVIVDLNIYDMPGVEVLLALKHRPETSHCVCVCVTVSADAGTEQQLEAEARSLGFRELWAKPIGLAFFQDRLRAWWP